MNDDSTHFDVAVVGGGPGGYAAAFRAADLGLSVALIDDAEYPGGVCLYRGCIPSKALLHVAKLLNEAEEAESWGISFGGAKIDLDKLRNWKCGIVDKLTSGLGQLCKARKIRYIRGRAEYVDSQTLQIAAHDGQDLSITTGKSIIATGSLPSRIPGFPIDDPRMYDSTSGLEISEIPKRMLIVGGGYIGLELGTVYKALGSDVTIVEMTPGLLPGADRDLVSILERQLQARNLDLLLSTKVAKISPIKSGLKVTFEIQDSKTTTEKFDKVLVAVGRKPNSVGLGLENTRATIDDAGFIIVDNQLRTSDPSIFAIGDVAGEPMLAHKATHEGLVAADVIAGHKVAFEANAIPAVVFTDPEIAWCGVTENECADSGRTVIVSKFPWAASGRALTLGRADGLTKIIADPETERVLGVGICGPGAGELIGEGALAIEMAASVTDLRLTIHPHPTLTETIMESAELHFGPSTHLYRQPKQ